MLIPTIEVRAKETQRGVPPVVGLILADDRNNSSIGCWAQDLLVRAHSAGSASRTAGVGLGISLRSKGHFLSPGLRGFPQVVEDWPPSVLGGPP